MISGILQGILAVIDVVLNLASILVIASVFVSWVSADPYNPLVQTVRTLTEPLFKPFRRLTQKIGGPIDLSPMIVMLIIIFLQSSLPRIFHSLIERFQ